MTSEENTVDHVVLPVTSTPAPSTLIPAQILLSCIQPQPFHTLPLTSIRTHEHIACHFYHLSSHTYFVTAGMRHWL